MKANVWTKGQLTVIELEEKFFFLINSEKKTKTALDGIKVLFNPPRSEFYIKRKKSYNNKEDAVQEALRTVLTLREPVKKRILNSFETSNENTESIEFNIVDVFDGFSI